MSLASSNAKNAYFRNTVTSAPPSQLLTMLYDRLLLDLHWAESEQLGANWFAASRYLMHAQAIVTELAATLKPELFDGGPALMSLYFYVLEGLRAANVNHDMTRTRESIDLLEPLRLAWHAAAASTNVPASFDHVSAVG